MLTVIYSNSMHALANRLSEKQQVSPLPPLQAETVIVQSNELARWLNLFLATRQQIAAQIEYPYPAAWLWQLFRRLWPDTPADSPYDTDALSWKIYALLPVIREQADFAPLDRYMGESADSRKYYDLARRIADTFDQYLMYRPDWINRWEAGETPHWQARLWQKLTENDPEPQHRARLLQKMQQTLSEGDFPVELLPSRLSIFGLSALPPVYLQLLQAVARYTNVDIYFPSPSEHYWGDLLDNKKQARQQLLFADETAKDEQGHPLLASLGKLGQTFFEQLQDIDHETEWLFSLPENDSLLGQLQWDIYELRPSRQPDIVEAEDRSLQIHSCHSPVRELEVLHDQLLHLFSQSEPPAPTDIVVMTPDIETYAPAIEAVFGAQPPERQIPFSIANRGEAMQQAIIAAFDSLLALPQSRFDTETILGLLSCPALQRRFAIDNEQLEQLRDWLQTTYTRWGLSGEDKIALNLPADDRNTWRAGLDRLMLGFALPPDEEHRWSLYNSQLPIAGVSGDRAQLMARLHRFIDTLDGWRKVVQKSRTPADWQWFVSDWLPAFFQPQDEADQAQFDAILNVAEKVAVAARNGEFDAVVDLPLYRDALQQTIELPEVGHRFMGQGVTFCDMVPMRSIPFEVVCLIGMDDSRFPRRQPRPGFDLLADDYRPGDRSRREDDRYLFLESILSAGRYLYISYVGASIRDDSVIPPSVLVSDLRDVVNQRFKTAHDQPVWEQLLTCHPLQSFSRRYFDDSDSKLFSFNPQACPPAKTETSTPEWFDQPLPEAGEEWRFVSLSQLIQFFSHPARYLAEQRLNIVYEAESAQLETREPFTLNGLDRWRLNQRLLDGRLQHMSLTQMQPVIDAIGMLPPGPAAAVELNQQLDVVNDFTEKLQPLAADSLKPAQRFEFECAGFTLTGQLDGLTDNGLLHYRMAKAKPRDVLRLWLSHLVLNHLEIPDMPRTSTLLTEDKLLTLSPVEEPQAQLETLLKLYWQGLHAPLMLPPEASYACASAAFNPRSRTSPENKASGVWFGNQQSGEASDPYHRLLLADFVPDADFAEQALTFYTPIQEAIEVGRL